MPIPRSLIDDLAILMHGLEPDDYVWRSPEDGPFRYGNWFKRHYKPAVERAGLPEGTRFHDLRHTHATLGLAAGIPVKVMSDRLGHATTAFTMDVYTHVIPKLQHDAAAQIAGLVFGVSADCRVAEEVPDAEADA